MHELWGRTGRRRGRGGVRWQGVHERRERALEDENVRDERDVQEGLEEVAAECGGLLRGDDGREHLPDALTSLFELAAAVVRRNRGTPVRRGAGKGWMLGPRSRRRRRLRSAPVFHSFPSRTARALTCE